MMDLWIKKSHNNGPKEWTDESINSVMVNTKQGEQNCYYVTVAGIGGINVEELEMLSGITQSLTAVTIEEILSITIYGYVGVTPTSLEDPNQLTIICKNLDNNRYVKCLLILGYGETDFKHIVAARMGLFENQFLLEVVDYQKDPSEEEYLTYHHTVPRNVEGVITFNFYPKWERFLIPFLLFLLLILILTLLKIYDIHDTTFHANEANGSEPMDIDGDPMHVHPMDVEPMDWT